MTLIEYQIRLWQVRETIEKKGIAKPIKLMKEQKMLSSEKDYNNFLCGRIRNEDFLLKLEKFSKSL